jgi:HEXXH motif-containing protein
VRDRLTKAGAVIRQTSELVKDFTNHFTKVLVVQKHPTEDTFSSGTTGQYIGRSVVTNMQRSDLNVAEVADSIVHEAIHALLSMQERRRKWVLEEDLYDSTPRAISPWSGRHLPLRAFLQACFVWYGLLNFWLQAYTRGIEIERSSESGRQIQDRIAAAATGFLKGSLFDHISEFTDRISPDILNAIEEMQQRLIDAFSRSIGGKLSQARAVIKT